MVNCKYDSFNSLAKINDPELLNEAFQKLIVGESTSLLGTDIFQHEAGRWQRLSYNNSIDSNIEEDILDILENNIASGNDPGPSYEPNQKGWFYSYKLLSTKIIVLLIKSESADLSIDENYLQLLFEFYCHQLQMLQGTYRDALTGLYNRRAFDEKMVQLLKIDDKRKPRANDCTPTIYAMLDIDHFKRINDTLGHLYGDEVLLLMANLMTDSFREKDLLFRYGGEEFALVMTDITAEQARQSLERFRKIVANYKFPNLDQVTMSIGYTPFDQSLSIDDMINQADSALYHCKATTRNAVHEYHQLVNDGLIPEIRIVEKTEIQIF